MKIYVWKILGSYTNYDQQQYKFILKEAMVYTSEGFKDNSLMSFITSVTVKTLVQVNMNINFLKYWMSNKTLLSTG